MNRRTLLAAVALLLSAPAIAAEPAPKPKTVEVGKVFPYLAAYLRLSPAERDRFRLVYTVTRDGKPAAGVTGWIEEGGRRIVVPVGAGGRVERLPTLAQLSAKRPFGLDVPPGTKMGVTMTLEPILRPAAELPAAELSAALLQAGLGAKKAAGVMRLVVPKLDTVRFPGGEGGEVVGADGRASPLAIDRGAPIFKPAAHPGARTVRFRTPPRAITLG